MSHRAAQARRVMVVAIALATLALVPPAVAPTPARGATLPSGFSESVAFSGLTNPMVVRFASDGRVFVAEKSGLIKVYDSLTDATPTTFADLRTQVYNFWDRGLMGMALDPAFPSVPNVYVLYARDATIGGSAPLWGDACPTPPGPNGDGCVVSGRLSRLVATGNVAGPEQVLINDFCQQYPSHSVGSLQFGPDGALYVSSGDGASFTFTDYGQEGSPVNPCGDPSTEGGALRSQDLRTSSDPAQLDGSILRLNPATGAAMAGNPNIGSSDLNARRIISHGLRNPFRFAFRPGTSELWIGDVGWNQWEEINRVTSPADSTVENFGWPCYEGTGRQAGYDGADLGICENLYAAGSGAVTTARFAYDHSDKVVPGESCPSGSSSISGIAFYQGGSYPDSYDGGMFFTDYTRDCIWFVPAGAGGQPNFAARTTFAAGAANPVNLEIGPGGDLFYPDFDGGTIRRIRVTDAPGPTETSYLSDLTPTTATNGYGPYERDRSNGEAAAGDGTTLRLGGVAFAKGLGVHAASELRYTLDGNCTQFTAQIGVDDEVGTLGSVVFRVVGDGSTLYTSPTLTGSSATVPVSVPITGIDELRLFVDVSTNGNAYDHGDWANALVTCGTGGSNLAPNPTISTPAGSLTWKVNDTITFSGSATDPEDGTVPANRLTWTLLIQHCPSTCHTHTVQTFTGASGSFVAPDHDYPSHLELRLTATDSQGMPGSTSVALQPKTVALTFASNPSGLQLTVGPSSSATPFSRTVIIGSANSITAPAPQTLGGTTYTFSSWSDGGAQTHNIVAPATAATYTANYTAGGAASTFLSDLTPTSQTNGWGPMEPNRSNGEQGAADGGPITLAGLTYAKGLGTHAASDIRYALGGNCTSLQAELGVDDEVGTQGSVTFSVYRNGTSIYTSPTLTGSSPTIPLNLSITGATELRLVVGVATGGSAYDHADWANARVTCGGGGGDTTPPTVTSTVPVSGATGVAAGSNVSATFSEAVTSIIPANVFLVKQGTGTPIAAALTYSASTFTATLNPNANLDAGGIYTVTVKGGTGGVRDIAGNFLAVDRIWSFTVAGGPPPATTYLSNLTPVSQANGWGPMEPDESNGEELAGDGTTITLNGVPFAKGLGTHAASDIRYTVPAGCTRFLATIGVDDEVGANGAVIFRVYRDATLLYTSPLLTGSSASVAVDQPMTPGTQLRLVTDIADGTAWYDHGDWADARLTCS